MAHDTTFTPGSGATLYAYDIATGGAYPATGLVPGGVMLVSANSTTAPTPVTAANGLYVQPGTATAWNVLPASPAAAAYLPVRLTDGSAFVSRTEYAEGDTAATPRGPAICWVAGTTVHAAGTANPLPVSDAGGSITVDGTVGVSGSVAVTGTFWQATQPVSGTLTTVTTVTTCSTVTNLAQIGGQAVAMGTGVRSAGTQRVTIATDDVVPATQSGTWNIATVTTLTGITNTVNTAPQAATSGGATLPYTFLSTAAVQAASIKASAGQVYGLHFFNLNATAVFVRLYNMTTSPATTDTPVYRAVVPGNTAGAGFVVALPPGIAFTTGIGIRVTGAVADADATSLAANTVVGNVFYK